MPNDSASCFTGPGSDRPAAAGGPVRLGQHRHGRVPEIHQALERRHREGRRPGKDHAPVQMTGTRSRGDLPATSWRRRPDAAPWPPSSSGAGASVPTGSRRTACRRGDPVRAGCTRPAGRPHRTRSPLPAVSSARTRIRAARVTPSVTPGTDRQPSSPVSVPSRERISRVDQHMGLVPRLGHVEHDQANMPVHLGCGQADPRRRVHGFQHVGRQLPDLGRSRPVPAWP